MRLAFFQPDIPQNLGAAIRLSACFATPLDLIEPCGFPLTEKALRRSMMDYGELANVKRHASWLAFSGSEELKNASRLVLFTTKGATNAQDFSFLADDVLLFGQESVGAPEEIHDRANARVVIPMAEGARSLNVAMSAGIALFEALRQTNGLPK